VTKNGELIASISAENIITAKGCQVDLVADQALVSYIEAD
jgi:hypothetical protein